MFDFILFAKAAILGIIQGLTEFIPVSSTGHMVIFGKLLEFNGEFAKTFEIFIQLGATSALIWHFRQDLFKRLIGFFQHRSPCSDGKVSSDRKFIFYLFVAFLPVAVMGLLFHKQIEFLLDSVIYVAIAQILGATLIVIAERISSGFKQKTDSLNTISFKQALSVGLWQIAALWPGMSRSGSTIMGGLLAKIDRPTAAQFSFYLSIPITLCSSVFMLAKHHDTFNTSENILLLIVGFVFAFIVGLFAVRFIMNYVRTHSFMIFAYYRYALGGLILFLIWQKILLTN